MGSTTRSQWVSFYLTCMGSINSLWGWIQVGWSPSSHFDMNIYHICHNFTKTKDLSNDVLLYSCSPPPLYQRRRSLNRVCSCFFSVQETPQQCPGPPPPPPPCPPCRAPSSRSPPTPSPWGRPPRRRRTPAGVGSRTINQSCGEIRAGFLKI